MACIKLLSYNEPETLHGTHGLLVTIILGERWVWILGGSRLQVSTALELLYDLVLGIPYVAKVISGLGSSSVCQARQNLRRKYLKCQASSFRFMGQGTYNPTYNYP